MPSSFELPPQLQVGPHMLSAPRPPSKPITSYLRFSKKIWEKVKVDRPNAPVWETSHIIGQMWRDLSKEEKSVYIAEYDADKEEYKKAFEQYRVALSHYQDAVVTAQHVAETNRLLLEAEHAAQLYVQQVPFASMPVRMKPEPLEQIPPQLPYAHQLENVLTGPHMLRPPGPGGPQLYLPHNTQLINYNQQQPLPQYARNTPQHLQHLQHPPQLPQPPQPSRHPCPQPQLPPQPPSSVAVQKPQQGETSEGEKKEDENIEDRIDVDSIKGIFGWATIDNVDVPYIVRKQKKYIAVRIVEKKLLSRYPNSFPDELGKKEPLISYFVTENEAKLLDEINQVHCSYEYGQQPFSCKDLIVDMSEFEDFYNIVKKTFPDDYLAKLRGEIPPQQQQQLPHHQPSLPSVPHQLQQLQHQLQQQQQQHQHQQQQQQQLQPPHQQQQQLQPQHQQQQQQVPNDKPLDHVKSELAKVCGWVQINNTVSPYIRRFNGKFVPLSVIKYAAGLLTDLQIEGTLPSIAECNLLNETCKAAGFDFTFGQNTKVIHLSEVTQRCQVNIMELPFDDPLKHAQYLDPAPLPPKPQPPSTSPGSAPQRPPVGMQIPNVNPFAGYPSVPPNPYFNMVPIMAQQRFPHQGMGQYPMPPQAGGRYPQMSPQSMSNSRPSVGPQTRQSHPSPTRMSSAKGPPQNQPPDSPLSMMTQMAQNGQMYPVHPAFSGQMPPGAMGMMNPMMRTGQARRSPSQRGPSQRGPAPRGSTPPSSQGPRMSPQGVHQSMQMPMTTPSEMIQPRGQMLHTAQLPQLSPSQSAITRFPNPLVAGHNQLNDGPIPNKPITTPTSTFTSSSPAATVSSSPLTVPNHATTPTTNGETALSQPPNSHPGEKDPAPPLVDKISGVVLHGKSISCIHLKNTTDKCGQFCLVEAVCKLYFSQSSMSEFLYALHNVLKIPLYSCSGDEEKAFIQYYNLPVNVLKCNKMISLSDLDKYFPQMSYMFNQSDTPPEAGETANDMNRDTSSSAPPTPSEGSNPQSDVSSALAARKRPSLGSPPAAPTAKQPCRRLEEMVQKLKQQSQVPAVDKGADDKEEPVHEKSLTPSTVPQSPTMNESGRKEEVIVLD